MSQDKLNFITFCIEEFKTLYSVSGSDIYKVFKGYCIIDFLIENYDVEHTLDSKIIIEDIICVLKRNGCDLDAAFSRF